MRFLRHGAHAPPAWVLGLIVAATASRHLIVRGLLFCPRLARAHPVRFLGALGTSVCGVALSIAAMLAV